MYDVLIKGGTIVDGTGKAGYTGDIAVSNGMIAAIGQLADEEAATTVDAQGKIVSPGFVDIHSHADLTVPHPDHDQILKPLIMQGVTTFVGGNCGFSNTLIPDEQRDNCIANIEGLTTQEESTYVDWKTPAEFMDKMTRRGLLLNMGLLAGHGSLRIAAAGLARRALRPDEQQRMEEYLKTSMDMGCLGLSSGLQYFPGLQSDTDELLGLARVLKKYDGIFTSHMRSYAHTLDNALDEVFEIGRRGRVRLEISHLYWQPYSKGYTVAVQKLLQVASFVYNRLNIPIPIEKGLDSKLERIDKARDQGLDVHFDLVPTAQGFTTLFAFLPPYVVEGSKTEALERLKNRQFRRQVLHDIENVEPVWPHNDRATWSFNYIKITGWGGLRVMAVTRDTNRWMEGKTFPEIGNSQGKTAMDALCDLLIEEDGKVLVFHTPLSPDDPLAFRSMRNGFIHPLSMPATDTVLLPFGRPSHVFYDCFVRFIEIFVKKDRLLTLEEAIRKCTSLPAEVMRIKGRGILAQGNHADIVIFDPDKLSSGATFFEPRVYPTGIDTVMINGRFVLHEGEFMDNVLAGKIIKRA